MPCYQKNKSDPPPLIHGASLYTWSVGMTFFLRNDDRMIHEFETHFMSHILIC